MNDVEASARRCDILHKKHADEVFEGLINCNLSSGQGLNQEISLKKHANTCWSSTMQL